MSSIFFQISRTDYIEAAKVYGYGGNKYGIRIISFQSGIPFYVYLPEMTIEELSVLCSVLKVRVVPDIRLFGDLQKYYINVVYY